MVLPQKKKSFFSRESRDSEEAQEFEEDTSTAMFILETLRLILEANAYECVRHSLDSHKCVVVFRRVLECCCGGIARLVEGLVHLD